MLDRTRQIRDGINIILAREPDADLTAEHDVIYCGSLDAGYTADECAALEALKWHRFEGVELNCWGFFT